MSTTDNTVLSNATKDTFAADVLNAEGPVLVDFWASWCGPCRALKPTVEYVAQDRKLRTVFVNVDEEPELAAAYGIQSIPALRLFKGGQLVAAINGALPKAELERWLDEEGA